MVEAHPHDYRHKGVRSVCWSAGCQHVLTVGRSDGILVCLSLSYTTSGEQQGRSALASSKALQNLLAEVVMKERDMVRNMQDWSPDSSKQNLESAHVSFYLYL